MHIVGGDMAAADMETNRSVSMSDADELMLSQSWIANPLAVDHINDGKSAPSCQGALSYLSKSKCGSRPGLDGQAAGAERRMSRPRDGRNESPSG